jgi:hypothetical protein
MDQPASWPGYGRRTPAVPPEHPVQRERHLLGQSWRPPLVRRLASGVLRGQDKTALAAFHLTQAADQADTAALAAVIEVVCPVVGGLAARADQDLLVSPDPALPRAVPAVRIHLPRATAIAGHGGPAFFAIPHGRACT